MTSVSSLVIGMLALFAFWLGVHFFNSYIVAALFLLASILIGKSLQPVVVLLWYKFQQRFFPLPPVYTLQTKDFPDSGLVNGTPSYLLGMRVLAMTEELDGTKYPHAYHNMIEESLQKLDHEFDLFRIRHEAVEKRSSPVEYLWSVCGPDGEQMSKCFKAWMKSPNVSQMKARQQNRDLFLHDGTVTLKNGRAVRYTVLVLFDETLPLTIPPKDDSAPAEIGSGQGDVIPADQARSEDGTAPAEGCPS